MTISHGATSSVSCSNKIFIPQWPFFVNGEDLGDLVRPGWKEGETSETTEGTFASQQAVYSIKSTQPNRHPSMIMMVQRECEVERVRGGCFPCRNVNVAASLSASDDLPGIVIDTTVQKRVMKLAPDPTPLDFVEPPPTGHAARSMLPHPAEEPQPVIPSRASRLSPSHDVKPPANLLLQPGQLQPAASQSTLTPRERTVSWSLSDPPSRERPRRRSHI